MIWITGPGRSGTTYIASLFWYSHRYNMGDTESPARIGQSKPRGGGVESKSISKINNAIIKKEKVVFDYPLFDVVKDPLFSLTWKHWFLSGRVPTHVIFSIRNTEAVKASWQQHGSDQTNMLIRSSKKFLRHCNKYEIPHTVLEFPKSGKDPKYLSEKLSMFIPQVLVLRKMVWKPKMVHFK